MNHILIPTVNGLRKLYWRFFIIRLSLRWMHPRSFHLGTHVVMLATGETGELIQGVDSPRWNISMTKGETRVVGVHEKHFRKARSLRVYLDDFKSGYRFYMRSWYAIWCREGIQPWMRGCNIWAPRERRG